MDVIVEVIIEEIRKISKSLELEFGRMRQLMFSGRPADFWTTCDVWDNRRVVMCFLIALKGKCLHRGNPVRQGSVLCPGVVMPAQSSSADFLAAFATGPLTVFDPADPEFFPKIKQRLIEEKASSRAGRLLS